MILNNLYNMINNSKINHTLNHNIINYKSKLIITKQIIQLIRNKLYSTQNNHKLLKQK
jgi:hypothetical protein